MYFNVFGVDMSQILIFGLQYSASDLRIASSDVPPLVETARQSERAIRKMFNKSVIYCVFIVIVVAPRRRPQQAKAAM